MKFEPGHLPVYFVPLAVFERVAGYTREQVLRKIRKGQWLENQMWRGDPASPLIDLRAYHDWAQGIPLPPPPRKMPRRRKPDPGEHQRRRAQALKRQTPAWGDRHAIDAIYAEARRLTLETGVEHQVDHVVPLQGKSVCGLHVEFNLRVLPADLNEKKGNRHDV